MLPPFFLGPCKCIDHGPYAKVEVAYSGPPVPSPTPLEIGLPYALPPPVETSGKVAEILVDACAVLAQEKHVSCDDDAIRLTDVLVMDGETTYPVYFVPPIGGGETSTIIYVKKPLK